MPFHLSKWYPPSDVVVMEVAADSELLHLHFVGATELAGSGEGVIPRMIEVVDVVRVDAHLRGKRLGVDHGGVLAAVAVQPREVSKGERLGLRNRLSGLSDRGSRPRVGLRHRGGHGGLHYFLGSRRGHRKG